jgi:hypothetical protein
MALTNSGMTLYTENELQQSWSGTDDLDDYNTSIQGTNSESWNVAKNSTETGTLSLSASMGTPKYFTCWMKSDLTNYYDSITMELQSTTNNYESFVVATNTDRTVTGEFHPSVLQIGQGTSTGTYVPNSHTVYRCIVNNSNSGNIRSVINNWIDAMYYGDGRIISGTTQADKLFEESHVVDSSTNRTIGSQTIVSTDTYDGCSEEFASGIAYYTDVSIETSVGNSVGEKVTWYGKSTTDSVFNLSVTGTASFNGTTLIGNGCKVNVNIQSEDSFSMIGGGITNGGTISFLPSANISGVVFSNSDEVDSNGATMTNCTISGTTEATTGSLIINSSTEADVITNMIFNDYQSQYAVYVDAGVTSVTLSNWQFDNPTSLALYWASAVGTLTISSTNGTNLSLAGCTSAGGTILMPTTVVLTINVKDENNNPIQDAFCWIDDDATDGHESTQTFIMNELSTALGVATESWSGGAVTGARWKVRKYGYKPYVQTIDVPASGEKAIDVTLIADPQQT